MKKHINKEKSFPTLLMIGTGVSLGTLITVSFIMALISSFSKDPTSLTGALSLMALLVAGGISAVISSRKNGDAGVLVATLSAVISAILMLAVGPIMNGGLVPFGTLVNLAVFIGVSALAAALGKRRTRRTKRRYSY